MWEHFSIRRLMEERMRRYPRGEELDFAIIGSGPGGSMLAEKLSAVPNLKIVVFEAGPVVDPLEDMVSDEMASRHLYWNEDRISAGGTPLALGRNNSGRCVGGSSVHMAAFMPRLHPSDFQTRTLDGVGEDWPLRYEDLEPYYQWLEDEEPIAGPPWYPWGKPHGPYRNGPHLISTPGLKFELGCARLGIRWVPGPVSILNGSSRPDGRSRCTYRGMCQLGCKPNAKASPITNQLPRAIRRGVEIRAETLVGKVEHDARGRANAVLCFDKSGRPYRQPARHVAVCGYAIETPRLLLNSASKLFPDGLCNRSGTVGRFFMAQAATKVMARFADLIRPYKGPPAQAVSEDFYETDPRNDFKRGFSLQTIGPLPGEFAEAMAEEGLWGDELRATMRDYNHFAAIGLLGEMLPDERNRVELARGKDATDRFGLPVARVTFDLFENDRKLEAAARKKALEVIAAAGGRQIKAQLRFAHIVGGCRMGKHPHRSVVDEFCRSHDVPNLFIADGSVFVTQGAANPALTIQAIAARAGDHLIARARRAA